MGQKLCNLDHDFPASKAKWPKKEASKKGDISLELILNKKQNTFFLRYQAQMKGLGPNFEKMYLHELISFI